MLTKSSMETARVPSGRMKEQCEPWTSFSTGLPLLAWKKWEQKFAHKTMGLVIIRHIYTGPLVQPCLKMSKLGPSPRYMGNSGEKAWSNAN